jgi:hypothetical protein
LAHPDLRVRNNTVGKRLRQFSGKLGKALWLRGRPVALKPTVPFQVIADEINHSITVCV